LGVSENPDRGLGRGETFFPDSGSYGGSEETFQISRNLSLEHDEFICLLDSQPWCCGSESFDYQAKIVRKTLIPSVLRLLYDFLSSKNDVKVRSKSNKQKKLEKNNI
jgi:hypothetical protein